MKKVAFRTASGERVAFMTGKKKGPKGKKRTKPSRRRPTKSGRALSSIQRKSDRGYRAALREANEIEFEAREKFRQAVRRGDSDVNARRAAWEETFRMLVRLQDLPR